MQRDARVALVDARLDRTLAQAADGAVAIGADGRIVLWNHAAARITGYPPGEVISRLCCDVLAGCDAHDNRICHRGCPEMLVTMGGPVRTVEMLTRTKTGKPIWLNVSILVLPESSERTAPTVHLFRDVTASKELLARVQEYVVAPRDPAEHSAGVLTHRELDLLRLMTLGLETEEAAERLQVSPSRVRDDLQSIFGKLGVHSRLEAVAYAYKHHLL